MGTFRTDQVLEKIDDGYVCWQAFEGGSKVAEQDNMEMSEKDSKDRLENLLDGYDGGGLSIRLSKVDKASKGKGGGAIKDDMVMKVRGNGSGDSRSVGNVPSRIDKEMDLVRENANLQRKIDMLELKHDMGEQIKELKAKKSWIETLLEKPEVVQGIFGMLGIKPSTTQVGITGVGDNVVNLDEMQYRNRMGNAITTLQQKVEPQKLLMALEKLAGLTPQELQFILNKL